MDTNRMNQYNDTFMSIYEMSSERQRDFRPQTKGDNLTLLAGVFESHYALAIVGENKDLKLNSTNLISVKKIDYGNDEVALIFLLEDENLLTIFISFAIDLESLIKIDKSITFIEIYNRYLYWQKMFKTTNKQISEAIIKGLINELYILQMIMIPRYGVVKALTGWIGTTKSHKDFAYEDGTWFEAKAINLGKKMVSISSIEQLQSETDGYLLVTEFENTSPENKNSYNLFSLLKSINDLIEVDDIRISLYEKIVNTGVDLKVFTDENCTENSYRYTIHNMHSYLVNNYFPKITREMLSNSISDVKYDLILGEIEKYKKNIEMD